jgi:hypothetical protein
MPDATITSTASTFGTISGVFSADQSTISGTISGTIPGTLTGSVGVPGPAGAPGVGVPAGGTAGQFLTKIDGTNYNTDWTTVNLSVYAVKANNLSDLPSASTARTNLGLGSLAVVNDAPSDGSQYARKNAAWEVVTTTPDYITSVSSPLSVTTGNLSIDLSAYAPLASPAFTGNPTAPTAALGDSDTSLATTAFVQQELASGVAVAKNLEVYVRNQSGSTIAAGSIVYISGATGNKPLITLAQANNDANSAQTMGFTKTAIANNGFGYVIVRGELENIDTSALTEGVQLYLSPTVAGSWTTTKPSAPLHLVYVGIVIRSHPTLGTILVAVQNGYELNELHDVAIGTLANNDLLAYESSTDLWKNKTFSALGLLTSAGAASTYVAKSGSSMTGGLTFSAGGYIGSFSMLAGNSITIPDGGAEIYESVLQNSGLLVRDASNVVLARFQADQVLIPSAGITFSDATNQTTAGLSPATAASTYYLQTNPAGYITSAAISGLAPLASPALTGNVTITSNSSGAALFIEQAGTGNILTLHDQALDTNFVAIDQNGKVSTIPSTTANAGFNVAHGVAPTTPVNGDIWTTTSGLFMRQNGVNKQYVDFDGSQTINGNKTFSNANQTLGNSTAAGTISVGTGATISGSTKTINIGTAGASGSTTAVNIGSSVAGATSSITLNGVAIASASTTSRPSLRIPHGSAPTTPTNGDLWTETTGIFVRINGASQQLVPFTALSTYAALGSPAFTGTPTAPTATAGTNTTQIATTAFVAAALPALATTQDSRQFTNDTKVMSPRDVLWSMLSQDFVDIAGPSMTVTNTGTITSVTVGQLSRVIRPGNAGACSSRIRTFGTSQVDQTWTASSRAQPASFLNFSLRSIHSGRSTTGGVTDANYTCAFYYGKAEADGVGNLTRRGYGWKMVGGAGSRFLELQAHNGTTLSSVTSSFAVTAGVAFDWDIESDGAGNVTLYVNGSSVATSTGGPTGSVNVTAVAWQEEVVAAAALSSPYMDFANSRGRYIVINTW